MSSLGRTQMTAKNIFAHERCSVSCCSTELYFSAQSHHQTQEISIIAFAIIFFFFLLLNMTGIEKGIMVNLLFYYL